jgi:hypothetical protein
VRKAKPLEERLLFLLESTVAIIGDSSEPPEDSDEALNRLMIEAKDRRDLHFFECLVSAFRAEKKSFRIKHEKEYLALSGALKQLRTMRSRAQPPYFSEVVELAKQKFGFPPKIEARTLRRIRAEHRQFARLPNRPRGKAKKGGHKK